MLVAAKICRASLPAAKGAFTTSPQSVGGLWVPSALKTPVLRSQLVRYFASDGREPFSRTARRRRTLKEIVMQPTQGTPFAVGKAAVAAGAVVGVGALCFYGLGVANKPGAIDRSVLWPEYVKERIKSTYLYLGSSLLFTGASAVACFRSPAIIRLMSHNSFLAIAGTMAAMVGTNVLVHSIPYQPGFSAKQLAWMLHTGVVGAVIAPLCLMAGPLAIRAAWYTAGVVGGLSTIAVCAPSDKFLYMAGPLAMGFGVVFVANLGAMFLPATTALGAGLYSISMYGGLLLFSGFLLYNTQRIIRSAETYPVYATVPYDPINASLGLYADTINIFVRILAMLMMNQQKKR